MKGSEDKLLKFMEGTSKRFIIPVYQRNYDWKEQQCKQLYNDLIKLAKNNDKSHFFGSIVCVFDSEGENENFLIIDGQQRLTTTSLLLLAIYNLLDEEKISSENSNLKDRILEEYLIDKWKPEENKIKLKPIKNDAKAYEKLFNKTEENIEESNISINYNFFYNSLLNEKEVTIDEFYNAMTKLDIINIKLSPVDDNPQLIFESLNSTGLALSEGDKIRNYVLMNLPIEKQESYYENYWNKIEKLTKFSISLFTRDYLAIKNNYKPAMKEIYARFKLFVEKTAFSTEELLIDMLNYAKLYNLLLTEDVFDNQLNSCISRLNKLETTVTRPFLLEVLMLQKNNKLSENDVLKIFDLVEIYIVRRNMCDMNTNNLKQIFVYLHKDIYNYEKNYDNYVEKFKYTLINKKEKSRLPKDDEFGDKIITKDIYNIPSKNKLYLFERLENYNTIETSDVWKHIEKGDYTIEHIMPQYLSTDWIESLGDDYNQIHEVWLHRIGNLTLTAYNSKYSNRSFNEKKNMENGFIDSGIKMNQKIAKYDKWTLDELEERSKQIKEKALKIWEYPTTNYKPPTVELTQITLDDDVELVNVKIQRYTFKDIQQDVKSWKKMYVEVVKLLHEKDKSILTKLAHENTTRGLPFYINSTPTKDFEKIDDNIYLRTGSNTTRKIKSLRDFFKLFDEKPSELTFYLKDTVEKQ